MTKKPYPTFANDDAEQAFLDTANLAEYDLTAGGAPFAEWLERAEAARNDVSTVRAQLVALAKQYESLTGVNPLSSNVMSETDAALILMGTPVATFAAEMRLASRVQRGFDFTDAMGRRIQVKVSRDSGKPGSTPTHVSKPTNLDFDVLVWVYYDRDFNIIDARAIDRPGYEAEYHALKGLAPSHCRKWASILPGRAAA